jgi:cellulose biosynthesis protein BcsQ
MHSGIVAVGNAKGGVGKTSIVANIAGIAALAGWEVLAVDLDPQGNLATDLGYTEHPENDRGRSIATGVRTGSPLKVIKQVRNGLDVIPGGVEFSSVLALLEQSPGIITRLIDPIADNYDLVLIDCPPAGGPIVDAALIASKWLIVPVRADASSLDGLQMIARRFAPIRRSLNPDLELLGIVLFDFARNATSILTHVRELLEAELEGAAPILPGPIRRSERSAFDMRRAGLLAHEYEEQYVKAERVPLSERIAASRAGDEPARLSAAAPGLASDYLLLANAVLARINEHEPMAVR